MNFMKSIETWLDKIEATVVNKNDLVENARVLLNLTQVAKEIDRRIKGYTAFILKKKKTVYFPEEEMKVMYLDEVEKYTVDVQRLYNKMVLEDNRLAEFLEICSVSKASLEKLSGGKELSEKFSSRDGKKGATISVREMSQDEKKKLEEGKL